MKETEIDSHVISKRDIYCLPTNGKFLYGILIVFVKKYFVNSCIKNFDYKFFFSSPPPQ